MMGMLVTAQWTTVANPGFSVGDAYYLSLAFSPDGVPYVGYEDDAIGQRTTVKKLNGSAWETVGNAGFSAGYSDYTSLAFSPDGVPYVAYSDGGNGEAATVMKFNNTAWVNVGNPGFSAGTAYNTSLAFSPAGVPYVAYSYYGNGYGGRATVMKFTGTIWETVGNAGFSAEYANYTSLAFSPDGVPYVAYSDGGNGERATVKKFDGADWVTVGNAGFSAGVVFFTSLAFSPDGVPYVAYIDQINGSTVTVMKYNSATGLWVNVGNAGSSLSTGSYYTSLAFSPDGVPYVAYQNGNKSGKATVMKFNNTAWEIVGNAGFSAGYAGYTSLAIGPDGVPYVAYLDGGNNNKATVMAYNNITTGALSGSFCPGTSVQVTYSAMGYYSSSNNTFTAQLSDASGNFANAATIGTRSSASSGTINATIPSTTLPGSGYRIRVIADYPVIAGSDNGQDITVSQLNTYYEDKDGDSYGNAAVTKQDCSQPSGYVTNNTDCDDSDPKTNSTVWVKDVDGDGYYTASPVTQCTSPGAGYIIKNNQQAGDCNDNDPAVHNPITYYRDMDGDGYGSSVSAPFCSSTAPAGYSARTGDLKDNDPAISPGAVEVCGNKVDDNCNGIVDENPCYACQNGTNLTTTSIPSNSAQLNWNATANPQQWQVQYKTTATGSKWIDVLFTGNIRSTNISSLKASQTYNWHIRAKCNGTWTAYANSVAFKTAGSISSLIVSSAVAASPSTLSLYPNPTNGQFVVELNVADKINTVAKIQLTDLTGKTVQTENAEISYGSLKKTMNITSALSKGIYTVRITVNGKV